MLNIEQIKELLPHREPFLMIDRVDEVIPGQYAEARKAVSANEWYFQGHFGEYKVMPGVLMLEAIAQAGAVAYLSNPENRGKLLFFGGVKKARFRRQVRPGDMLVIRSTLDKVVSIAGFGHGEIYVDGELAVDCELTFAIQEQP
mgnify:CR=1 FL=1|jgi:3-hydroxyacyl-[acyl-carrier-protein] dehydratase